MGDTDKYGFTVPSDVLNEAIRVSIELANKLLLKLLKAMNHNHKIFVDTVHNYFETSIRCLEIKDAVISKPISLRGTISSMFSSGGDIEYSTINSLNHLLSTVGQNIKFKVECYTLDSNYNYHVLILKPIKDFGWVPLIE